MMCIVPASRMALTIPSLTVLSSPSGAPIATTRSPTFGSSIGLSGERWKGSSRYLYGCYVMVNFVSKNRIDPVRLTARNFHVERLGSSDYVIIRDDNAIARKHVAAALLRFLSILVEVFDDNY